MHLQLHPGMYIPSVVSRDASSFKITHLVASEAAPQVKSKTSTDTTSNQGIIKPVESKASTPTNLSDPGITSQVIQVSQPM